MAKRVQNARGGFAKRFVTVWIGVATISGFGALCAAGAVWLVRLHAVHPAIATMILAFSTISAVALVLALGLTPNE